MKQREDEIATEKNDLYEAVNKKDSLLKQWEQEFKEKENEMQSRENILKTEFSGTLTAAQKQMSLDNAESMAQLRKNLDCDHKERSQVLEETMHEEYENRIRRLKDDYEQQVCCY